MLRPVPFRSSGPCSFHRCFFVSFEPEPKPITGRYSGTRKKAMACCEVSGSCFAAAEVAKVVVFPCCWSIHSINEARREKRECGNHYSDGDRGGLFHSLLGLFLPIYSISCYCPMNANLLQMYYYVYLSVWSRNTECIHSAAESQV